MIKKHMKVLESYTKKAMIKGIMEFTNSTYDELNKHDKVTLLMIYNCTRIKNNGGTI